MKTIYTLQFKKENKWDFFIENFWDSIGDITVYTNIEVAKYWKRRLEKRFYKKVDEIRIVKIKHTTG